MTDPEVGRIVHYRPGVLNEDDEPWAGIVEAVHAPRLVDLTLFRGGAYHQPNVQFVREEDPKPRAGVGFAHWPTHHQVQAQRTTSAENALINHLAFLDGAIAGMNDRFKELEDTVRELRLRLGVPVPMQGGNIA